MDDGEVLDLTGTRLIQGWLRFLKSILQPELDIAWTTSGRDNAKIRVAHGSIRRIQFGKVQHVEELRPEVQIMLMIGWYVLNNRGIEVS